MAIVDGAPVIGLTGPFGSGCSTAGQILADRCAYTHVKLAETIRKEWKTLGKPGEPSREDLQALGDKLRETGSLAVLAKRTVDELEKDPGKHQAIALDGVRNIGEVKFLREKFGERFSLIAMECPKSERWERLKPNYEKKGLTYTDFDSDDRRDKGEEDPWGQQVQLCVDRSDVLLVNDDEVTQVKLQKKLT